MGWIDFTGKIAVVTGGSGGIGRAMLATFKELGATVVALDYRAEDAEAAAHAVDGYGFGCDVSDPASVAKAAAQIAKLGGADVLVNNAGILRPGPLEELALEDWQAMLRVNLDGCFITAQAFGAQMIAKGKGALIHVASISASQPQPFSGAYSPGKAGVAMLSRTLAYEWGPKGLRSNVVSPGLVLTPMSEPFYANTEVKAARERRVPTGRIGAAEDMAHASAFLASDRASYINGQEIVVDGGLSQTLMGSVPRPGFTE
ncbi:SDR family NAD(P)-dependent oxidoreductase [Celeribacter naphthalenivorans]|uniref:SDR family NAD(P)-dependent oxidoreductase n=1 Tax=Celeribacter naphthalenivorans TaxID=1614694 RepID=UPI001CFC0C1B|nr:SDR family oxidoreductase [Celeribacter naphthalenivorans]